MADLEEQQTAMNQARHEAEAAYDADSKTLSEDLKKART